ncbi:conserved hypothetical protein [Culex quinquefasciatus]|uniref:Uncharacterized protein n=1 Tax=Culex quinquefasciatus TaxID=7176 RepID=B0WPN1_CULQU|nr:conserved hypothetical protein [Culex quinquefasciatus]|eukprot:XP_001850665.1 conserved hypothetical protein [Culex quinquefasciatus]
MTGQAGGKKANRGPYRQGEGTCRQFMSADSARLPGIPRKESPLAVQQAARRNTRQPKELKIKPASLIRSLTAIP